MPTSATASCGWQRWVKRVRRPVGASMLGCRMTQAIGRLKRKGQPELERLKRRLEQAYENHNGEVRYECENSGTDPFRAKHDQRFAFSQVLSLPPRPRKLVLS